jgi:formate-dependent nitrite reductase cytochrome c552 subunit
MERFKPTHTLSDGTQVIAIAHPIMEMFSIVVFADGNVDTVPSHILKRISGAGRVVADQPTIEKRGSA